MKKSLLALLAFFGFAVCSATEIVPDYHFTVDSLLDVLEDGAEVTEWYDTKKQVAFILPQKTKRPVKAPIFKERIMDGNPALYFDNEIRTLYVPGLANKALAGKSFTFIYAGVSMNGNFGFAGNLPDGTFMSPPLAIHCGAIAYGSVKVPLLTSINYYRVNAYTYNAETGEIITYHNGYVKHKGKADVIDKFGGGGHLVMPAMPWPHAPRKGMISEIQIYSRVLTPAEVKKVCHKMIGTHRGK